MGDPKKAPDSTYPLFSVGIFWKTWFPWHIPNLFLAEGRHDSLTNSWGYLEVTELVCVLTCFLFSPSLLGGSLGSMNPWQHGVPLEMGAPATSAYPHLQNGIGGGGISTPGIPFRVPFMPFVRLNKWNCGTPPPLSPLR